MTWSLEPKVWWAKLAFFVGIPILLSLPVGVFRAGLGQFLPLEISVAFWATTWLLTWLSSELILQVLHRLLRPWNTPIWAEIVLAVLLATALSALYFPVLMHMASQFAFDLPKFAADRPGYRGSFDHMLSVFVSGTPGIVAWIALRSVFAMLPHSILPQSWLSTKQEAGAPTQQPSHPKVGMPSPTMSRFARELYDAGIIDTSKVVAIQANDHYVNVILTDAKEHLILSRFTDAVDAMAPGEGIRIHRSFWVRRDAIQDVEQDGTHLLARLQTGHTFPVSAKYRGLVEHVVRQR
ncbi:LytTR family DNA-binding domain-containing protein [Altererythrobacter sp. GH1-8]|uniref:LytTR family DNA-binding domain-containing protein n=1 Tax=Altererythrobacter sp. GH1-8 TaxID=3349333 RepID=UPI00374D70BC